jgi:hypothetical protein
MRGPSKSLRGSIASRTIACLLLLAALMAPSHLVAQEPRTPTAAGSSEADLIRAHAERTKAEAEKSKADVESRKLDLEVRKLEQASRQFNWDFLYKVGLFLAGAVLAVWLIPQVSEITIPWGPRSFGIKRARKEPPDVSEPPAVSEPQLAETREILKNAPLPEPAAGALIDRLEAATIYQRVGVAPDEIYLCHHAKPIRRTEFHRLQIYLDAETGGILDKVDHVTYRLHSTFAPQNRTQTDRRSQFELVVEAWGEFMLYASVYFKGEPQPIELKRYLNF